MRVYVSADLEGVAGVVSPQQTRVEGFEFALARRWMTHEVVAACEAARAAGAVEVIVSDSHGTGQNLLLDELPAYVRVARNWPRPLGMMQGIEVGAYAGAILLGHHAGAHHDRGVLAHTLHSRMIQSLALNGRPASEIVLAAATAGHYGVPVVLVTGTP
jgi:D-amino peptidase